MAQHTIAKFKHTALFENALHYENKTTINTGHPGSVIVPQYDSSKITVFVWGKNTILKFVGNT